jgi:hypothetical protein
MLAAKALLLSFKGIIAVLFYIIKASLKINVNATCIFKLALIFAF